MEKVKSNSSKCQFDWNASIFTVHRFSPSTAITMASCTKQQLIVMKVHNGKIEMTVYRAKYVCSMLRAFVEIPLQIMAFVAEISEIVEMLLSVTLCTYCVCVYGTFVKF